MVLICLVYDRFYNNLKNKTFPNHVIEVFKQDVTKIKYFRITAKIRSVELPINLSKLEELSMFLLHLKYNF